jgi:predicted amidohydrolase YtcJ
MLADVMIKGKAIFTGVEDVPGAYCVAIKNEKIIAVDELSNANHYVGENTEVIDAGENLVMPGFHDSHLHLTAGALFTAYSVSLTDAISLQETLNRVADAAQNQSNSDWVIGTGWDHTAWGQEDFPTKEDLDLVVSDRPVLLLHAEGHYAWVNSKALAIAGITNATPDPEYGTIYKDTTGEPTGMLIETAISLVGEYAYDFSEAQMEEMVQFFLDHAARYGVTSANDLYMSRAHEKLVAYDTLEEFDNKNKLTVRVHLYPPMCGDLSFAQNMKAKFTSPSLQVSGVKQFIDGVVTGHTALMLDPYQDKPDTKGEISYSREELQKWVIEADKEGFQIRFHSIGDGAVRLGLDLFEKAQAVNGKHDSRHALEHIEVVSPDDLPRFKALGVLASIQTYHIALMPRESHTHRVSKEKYDYLYPNKTLVDAGAVVPISSDFPIVDLNPLKGIYHAVTRKDFSLKDTWNEREKISLPDALRAYTQTAAYTVFRENELGTLEEGKYADITILDRNLFNRPAEEILEAKVERTLMGGRTVFREKSNPRSI